VRRPFDIRVGDEWVFYTNTGGLSRTITSIDSEYIGYTECGSYVGKSCLKSTFRRWWRGARLEFATDWQGREAQIVAPRATSTVNEGEPR
jgi:hypothetical protein